MLLLALRSLGRGGLQLLLHVPHLPPVLLDGLVGRVELRAQRLDELVHLADPLLYLLLDHPLPRLLLLLARALRSLLGQAVLRGVDLAHPELEDPREGDAVAGVHAPGDRSPTVWPIVAEEVGLVYLPGLLDHHREEDLVARLEAFLQDAVGLALLLCCQRPVQLVLQPVALGAQRRARLALLLEQPAKLPLVGMRLVEGARQVEHCDPGHGLVLGAELRLLLQLAVPRGVHLPAAIAARGGRSAAASWRAYRLHGVCREERVRC
mmetsp:Transcript_81407/g.263672  ORF Transcript_81407/g.263672 Transcript_81407/m.263672 type:complete len:265 (+) Transcript_81407:950-1744(+)